MLLLLVLLLLLLQCAAHMRTPLQLPSPLPFLHPSLHPPSPGCSLQGVGRALQRLLPPDVPLNLRLVDNYVKVWQREEAMEGVQAWSVHV